MPVRGARTATRAVHLLQSLAETTGPLTVADLARKNGLNASAAYRVVRALLEEGYVSRDPTNHGFVIGSGLLALAAQALGASTLRELARPTIEKLAIATSETVTLHVRRLRYRVCVAGIESPHPIRRAAIIGQSVPLFAGPTGKVVLAFLPETEVTEVLRWARSEGEDVARIAQHLKVARTKGYLALVNDRTEGVSGLSAPICDGGRAVAAITISGPAARFTRQSMEKAAPQLVRECRGLV